jgi:hypothetical protein
MSEDTKENKENYIKTCCRDCFFAIYKDSLQTGCKLDRIEKFRSNGATIIEATDYEKDFYVIEGRFCKAYRLSSWASDREDPIQACYDEIALDCEVYIYCNGDTGTRQVHRTLESLFLSKHKIDKITIINSGATKVDWPIILQALKDKRLYKWRIETVTVESDTREKSFDIAVLNKSPQSQYFLLIDAGKKLEKGFLAKLDSLINRDLKQIFVVVDKNMLFGMISPFIGWGGNRKKSFIDKVNELAKEQDSRFLVYTKEEVCSL